jgi:membrane protease YdiL (CAAX protease family)
LVVYFSLAYLIAWGGSFAIAGMPRLRGETISMVQYLLVFLTMFLGPSIAGIVLTTALEGRSGLRDLQARLGIWRVGPQWWAVALLANPLLLLAVLYGLSAWLSPDYRPHFNPILGLVVGGLAGFFEEIGWTGFATPRLLRRYGTFGAGLRLGLVWGVWHTLAGFWGSTPGQELFWLADALLFWVLGLTAYRVLMTWVYSKTGSVLVAQVMHLCFTGIFVVFEPPMTLTKRLPYDLALTIGYWVIVGIIVWRERASHAPVAVRPLPVARN